MTARKFLVMVAALAASVVFTGGMALAGPSPDVISLPDGFQPEGIVVGTWPTAYAGSLADGDIYAANLKTGAGEVVIEGPGTPAVGLDFDARSGYLFVAGGPVGDDARIYDTRTGELVAAYDFGGGFVNDVIVARDAAYFTDSFAPFLYKVELGRAGEPTGGFTTLTLGGDFEFVPNNFNTNGIVVSPNGKNLIVVNSALGALYNVDPQTGDSTLIDLGGADAANGDGLVLVGRRLYVVQNFQNRISEFWLSPDGSSAAVVDSISSPDFDIPTTADVKGKWLYAVNARFSTPPSPITTYEIVRVAR